MQEFDPSPESRPISSPGLFIGLTGPSTFVSHCPCLPCGASGSAEGGATCSHTHTHRLLTCTTFSHLMLSFHGLLVTSVLYLANCRLPSLAECMLAAPFSHPFIYYLLVVSFLPWGCEFPVSPTSGSPGLHQAFSKWCFNVEFMIRKLLYAEQCSRSSSKGKISLLSVP